MSIHIHTLKKKKGKNIHVQEIIPMKNKPLMEVERARENGNQKLKE